MADKLLFLDCDSTLSAIEGIDELARLRGPATYRACEEMTNRAMDGEIALEDVYGARLELIRPSLAECLLIGQQYIDTIERTAMDFLKGARAAGWSPIILSGGLTQALLPFVKFLGVDRLRAVDLLFDDVQAYAGFDRKAPTSRMRGKIEVIEAETRSSKAKRVAMIGDGSSDLETQPYVDVFIGFGGFVERPKVKSACAHFVYRLSDALPLLDA